ncbi:MAG: methyltransferase domain-containing protein [Candidatus Bathyarchaeia archaeon]
MIGNLFFLLSRDHPTLPGAEVLAILQAEGLGFEILCSHPGLVRLRADLAALKAVGERSFMCKICGLELAHSDELDEAAILRACRDSDPSHFLSRGDRFAVRVRKLFGAGGHLRSPDLERSIGALIASGSGGAKVDLEGPDKLFLGIISQDGFTLGLAMAKGCAKSSAERAPRRRPFFHPSSMPPKLARCMVNLSRAKAGEAFLDPFCGAGGILLEAASIGCETIGSDIDPKMIRGARANLEHFGLPFIGLVRSDAILLPIQGVRAIATDPPYGRRASSLKRRLEGILAGFLPRARDSLAPGGHLCMAHPSSIDAASLAAEAGFDHIEGHELFVHKGLTRIVSVFRRR